MDETIAQFASPAKRRKMSKFAAMEAGGLCSPDPKGAGSRLKGNKTPAKTFKFAHDMPATPGSKLTAAGLDDGLLSASPEQLPADLMLLHHLLGALYVTMPLVKSRSKSTTYQNLRVPVQNFTGRDFQIKHIQQIKALCPEAINWEYILATNATNGKQEQQLLLKMPVNVANSKQAADTAQMQQLFFTRLQKHMHQASSCELPVAELPPLAGPNARDCTPNRRPINLDMLPGTPQTAPPAGYLSQVQGSGTHGNQLSLMSPPPKRAATSMKPKSLEGLMSPPPARTRAAKARQAEGRVSQPDFTFSPAPCQPDLLLSPREGAPGPFSSSIAQASTRHHTPVRSRAEDASETHSSTPAAGLRPNKLFGTPVATATPVQTSTGQRPTDKHATPVAAPEDAAGLPASRVKVRKLTFADCSAKKAPAPADAAVEANRAPKSSGITFELGGKALALLEKVTNAEAQQQKAVRQKELDQQRALDMLPGTFDVLRAIYGDKGPCVKGKSELLVLLRQKSTCKSGMSPADASEQLELLLRFIPEFVRTINGPGQSLAGMTQSVRINRQVSWPAARQKLLAAAAKARSSGISAAAEALAAEEQREKQEAAAAAAAVEVEQSENESEEDVDYEAEPAEVACGGNSSMNETPLDILAQVDGGSNSKAGSSRQPAGVTDEVALLLGGGPAAAGTSKQNGKGVSTDALLSCLAFKAPATRRT